MKLLISFVILAVYLAALTEGRYIKDISGIRIPRPREYDEKESRVHAKDEKYEEKKMTEKDEIRLKKLLHDFLDEEDEERKEDSSSTQDKKSTLDSKTSKQSDSALKAPKVKAILQKPAKKPDVSAGKNEKETEKSNEVVQDKKNVQQKKTEKEVAGLQNKSKSPIVGRVEVSSKNELKKKKDQSSDDEQEEDDDDEDEDDDDDEDDEDEDEE